MHFEPELHRPVRLRRIDARPVTVEASDSERAALAARFSIPSIESLKAEIFLDLDKDRVRIDGTMEAAITQECAVSGEPFPVQVNEPISLVFIPSGDPPESSGDGEIEIELEREDLDEIEYEGDAIDVGEAVAQSLALAIDPYAEGPGADSFRKEAGLQSEGNEDGPMADMLAALKKGQSE